MTIHATRSSRAMAAIHPGEERMSTQIPELRARSAAAAGVDSISGSICSRE